MNEKKEFTNLQYYGKRMMKGDMAKQLKKCNVPIDQNKRSRNSNEEAKRKFRNSPRF